MIKLKRKVSARSQINIREVKDGVLILPGNKYRMVLETSAVNFELKSEEEQDQIIDTFQNFLNSLPCPVQILIRTREIDIDGYLQDFLTHNNHETEKVYKDQLSEYTKFVKKLVSGNKILTRKFYIVIPSTDEKGKQDFALIKEQLTLNREIVAKSLEKLGMKTRVLGNLEILDMFYSFYNPTHLKTQPLTQKTFQALFTNTYGL
jgi:hypothetical protein